MEDNMEHDEEQVSPRMTRKRRFREQQPYDASPGFSLDDFGIEIESADSKNPEDCDTDDEDRRYDEPPAKYREIDVNAPFRLDQFSDEMLYEIFKHLDSWTLMALMNCCDRFYTLVLDRRFWTHIDLSQEPLPLGILEDVLERTHPNTRCVKLHGPSPSQHADGEIQQLNRTLSETFAKRLTKLSVLELQGVTVDFRAVRIGDFPNTLQRLVFHDCDVRMPECIKSIFAGIDTHLTQLQELGIEYSDWFDSYYIMIFSKLPVLRWLSLMGCQHLPEFVPYGSMAARFGFKRLEFLDMRFTPITDSDLQCFNAVVTLREILLDCPENLRADEESAQPVDCSNELAPSNLSGAFRSRQIPTAPPPAVAVDNESPSTSTASAAAAASAAVIAAATAAASAIREATTAAARAAALAGAPAEEVGNRASLNAMISISPPSSSCRTRGDFGASGSFAVQQPQPNSSPSYTSSSSSSPSSSSSSSSSPSNSSSSTYVPIKTQACAGSSAPSVLQRTTSQDGSSTPSVPPSTPPQEPAADAPVLPDADAYAAAPAVAPTYRPAAVGADLPAAPDARVLQVAAVVGAAVENNRPNMVDAIAYPAVAPAAIVNVLPQAGGNLPPHARFLPRPDQIIYLDLHNRRRPVIMHGPPVIMQGPPRRPPNNYANQVDQVLNHPLFWDMVNPLARNNMALHVQNNNGNAGAGAIANDMDGGPVYVRDIPGPDGRRPPRCIFYNRQNNRHRYPITDRGICCFGRPQNPVEQGVIWIRIGNRPSENRFERLSVRNYRQVTDISLQHLVQCSPHLVYLDLSGTSVTLQGIRRFRATKPHCEVVASHLNLEENDAVDGDGEAGN